MSSGSLVIPGGENTTDIRAISSRPWISNSKSASLTSLLFLAPVLIVAALLNFWDLSKEGYANTYYAAAVRSMSESWHAFWFNSLDPAGFVTIDKPPLGFWLQVASAKVFGYNGVALMLPQALA